MRKKKEIKIKIVFSIFQDTSTLNIHDHALSTHPKVGTQQAFWRMEVNYLRIKLAVLSNYGKKAFLISEYFLQMVLVVLAWD